MMLGGRFNKRIHELMCHPLTAIVLRNEEFFDLTRMVIYFLEAILPMTAPFLSTPYQKL